MKEDPGQGWVPFKEPRETVEREWRKIHVCKLQYDGETVEREAQKKERERFQ